MSNGQHPLVSIIIASYNHVNYVEEAIRSVLSQTYDNIQLIVVDDASTDGSVEKIDKLSRYNGFLFVKNAENLGLNRSLDRAIAEVKGKYLGWFASDDAIFSDKIAKQVDFLEENGLDGVYSTGYLLYPDDTRVYIDLDSVDRMFANGTYLEHVYICDSYGALFQSGLFKADILKALSPIRKQFWSDDWAVAIKLLENHRIGFLNAPVFLYRQHPTNIHKQYWETFPGRIQVVSLLTPSELRLKGLSNVIGTHGEAILGGEDSKIAKRLLLASLVMDFNWTRLGRCLQLMNLHPARVYRAFKRIVQLLLSKMVSFFRAGEK